MPFDTFPFEKRDKWGHECPRPAIPVKVAAGKAYIPITFILDTGADVSLVPIPVADALHIPYERDPPERSHQPVTLAGRLDGYCGHLGASLLGKEFDLPCFFYHPANRVPPGRVVGPPGHRQAGPTPETLDDWENEYRGSEGPAGRANPTGNLRCVLGRLGFLSKFSVLLQRTEAVISTDPIPPPRRRGR